MTIQQAIADFRRGMPVLVFDSNSREKEVDLIIHASAVTPKVVARLRNDAGGLICVVIGEKPSAQLGLPFADDLLKHELQIRPLRRERMPYGDKSAFSITVNSRDTYTGVTDRDRAKTITQLAKIAAKPSKQALAAKMYSPGHVQLLVSRGFDNRRGHTELAERLCQLAGLPACAVVCEMLDSKTGKALAVGKAKAYAKSHRLALVQGKQLI